MKTNYLVVPNKKEDVSVLSGYKILYPLKSFCVGFNDYFEIDEMLAKDAFIYINRLLTSENIDKLKSILSCLPKNIKGMVFEDLGLQQILKDANVETIFFSQHILTNSKSVNGYLKYFDSCVISPDLSLEEINNIVLNSIKSVCVYGFGHMPLSYSRRRLNTNYATNYNLDYENNLVIKNTDYSFITNENEYGTITYDEDVFSCLDVEFKLPVRYYIVNLFNINAEDFINKKVTTTDGFLSKKVFYKLK